MMWALGAVTIQMTGVRAMAELVARGDVAINIRYRPMRFSEVVGMTANKEALGKWMGGGGKRSRALLLHGSLGSGKTTIARILAMGLNCAIGDTVEPCLECASCKSAMAGKAMHITEYNMGASSRKDDAEDIVASMWNACFTGRNRVFILDEVQEQSKGSQALLLKTLEEPPKNTYMILCTTDPQKLLKTLRSRCENYEFRVPTANDIKQVLASVVKQEMPEMTVEQRREIFEACRGLSYREILMTLEKYVKGGGVGNISELFVADYYNFAKLVMAGDYLSVLDYITANEEQFDVEPARRMLRTFFSNQVGYALKNGDGQMADRFAKAFAHVDKGFYADPNPMPSFKVDLYGVCRELNGK